MDSKDSDFRTLLDDVLAGKPDAAEQFCRTYQSHILRVVRRRLMKKMRMRYDSVDFVQDVWASFFAEPPRERCFPNAPALIAYLERMAQFKVGACVRQQVGAATDNVYREQSMDADDEGPDCDLADRKPSASQEFYAREKWDQLLAGLTPLHQQILRLLNEGLTYEEVADRLQTTERTVQRVLKAIVRKQEEWERTVHGLPPQHQRILRLLRRGWTCRQIADQLQTTEKTIERILRHLQKKVAAK